MRSQAIARQELETVHALLRARKLDRTLTSVRPDATPGRAPFQVAPLDDVLGGGVPRGQVSEIVGPASSGRTTLALTALAAATARGEWVALVDTFDRFDPESAASMGLDLTRLLWVRGQALSKTAGAVDPAWIPSVRAVSGPGTMLERTIDRAIKALNLIAQSGVCTLVVLDLIDVPATGLSRVPPATWLRIQRVIEGTDTAVVLLAATPVARSAGGWSMTTGKTNATGTGNREPGTGNRESGVGNREPGSGSRESGTRACWRGNHDRSRRLTGLATRVRATSPRGVAGELPLTFDHERRTGGQVAG